MKKHNFDFGTTSIYCDTSWQGTKGKEVQHRDGREPHLDQEGAEALQILLGEDHPNSPPDRDYREDPPSDDAGAEPAPVEPYEPSSSENEEELEQDSSDAEESSEEESETENEDSENEDNDRNLETDTHLQMPLFPWEREDDNTETNPAPWGKGDDDSPVRARGNDDQTSNNSVGNNSVGDSEDEVQDQKANNSVDPKETEVKDQNDDSSEDENLSEDKNSSEDQDKDQNETNSDRNKNNPKKNDDTPVGEKSNDGPKTNNAVGGQGDVNWSDDRAFEESERESERTNFTLLDVLRNGTPPVGAKDNDDQGNDDSSEDEDNPSDNKDKDRNETNSKQDDNPPVGAKGNDDQMTNNSVGPQANDDSSKDDDKDQNENNSKENDDSVGAPRDNDSGEDDSSKNNSSKNNSSENKDDVDYNNPKVRKDRRLGRTQDTRPENVKHMKDKCVRDKVKMVAKHTEKLHFCSTYGDKEKHKECPGFIHFFGSYDDIIPKTSSKLNYENDWEFQRKKGPKLTFLVDPAFKIYRERIGDQLINAGNWFKENPCGERGPYHTQTATDYFNRCFRDDSKTEQEMEKIVQKETEGMTTEEKVLFRRSVNAVMGKQQCERYKKKEGTSGSVCENRDNCFEIAHQKVREYREEHNKKKLASNADDSVQNLETVGASNAHMEESAAGERANRPLTEEEIENIIAGAETTGMPVEQRFHFRCLLYSRISEDQKNGSAALERSLEVHIRNVKQAIRRMKKKKKKKKGGRAQHQTFPLIRRRIHHQDRIQEGSHHHNGALTKTQEGYRSILEQTEISK